MPMGKNDAQAASVNALDDAAALGVSEEGMKRLALGPSVRGRSTLASLYYFEPGALPVDSLTTNSGSIAISEG
jgi:hypothetical protein